jgi:hypothetical protein
VGRVRGTGAAKTESESQMSTERDRWGLDMEGDSDLLVMECLFLVLNFKDVGNFFEASPASPHLILDPEEAKT